MGSCLSQEYEREMNPKQFRPGLELGSIAHDVTVTPIARPCNVIRLDQEILANEFDSHWVHNISDLMSNQH